MEQLNKDINEVLVSAEQLEEINKRLGEQITKDFEGKNLLVVGILKGSVYFMTDLTRYIDLPLKLDFLAVSSYGGGTVSTGAVKIIKDIDI
ncbi:MAG: hypoxanthine phosphoribosyltransferase, partial [Eubacterium sp.]|nr:hypoxanthine phosphoribosyltransferase [Eubacterium sp.]